MLYWDHFIKVTLKQLRSCWVWKMYRLYRHYQRCRKPYANLYQTIPTNEVIKDAMFDYMRTKNGNIIAVVDKKKESIVQYLKQYQRSSVRRFQRKRKFVCRKSKSLW
jgi:hypothetical protein